MNVPHSTVARAFGILATSAAFAAGGSLAAAQSGGPAPSAPKRPSYAFLRQNEDWSVLPSLDASVDHDVFDALKNIPLSHTGTPWLSVGAWARTRLENWKNFNFGAPPSANHDDSYVLTLALVNLDLHLSKDTRVYVEGKTAQSTDRDLPGGRRTLDADWLDLQQGFAQTRFDLGSETTVDVRAGRQMLSFGKQRLISPLPWANTLRAWDGLTAKFHRGAWNVTAIATLFAPVIKESFNEADADDRFFGLYGEHPDAGGKSGEDVYWLGVDRNDQSVNGTSGDLHLHTFGARNWGSIDGWNGDYEIEGAVQVGRLGGEDVTAAMLALELGGTVGQGSSTTRLHGNVDWASGDSSAGGAVHTFNQLFPLGHAYFGAIDAIGRQNIFDVWGGAQWKPRPEWNAGLELHSFWLADENDGLYNAGGVLSRAATGQSSHVGFEADLLATWKLGRHVVTQAGYSHFFAGDAIADSGPDDDIDFVFLSLEAKF